MRLACVGKGLPAIEMIRFQVQVLILLRSKWSLKGANDRIGYSICIQSQDSKTFNSPSQSLDDRSVHFTLVSHLSQNVSR